MNKLLYRIVFNKTRGMRMVVAEKTRSQSKNPGQSVTGYVAPNTRHLPPLARMAFLIGVVLGTATPLGALAQVVSDLNAPGQQRATVLNAANGVAQVNIQTPSAAGVSRNVYSQFDVPKSGVILNNSRTNVQTQLGGWVQGNPWLSTGTARVILNEVRSSNPSRLQGYIEVAGNRAETIIANPAGIVVDGAGFINVSRATLTTGTPVFEDGRLNGYSVQRGQIVVGGTGLDASKTDYTALIARSLEVNAGLWAQYLDVIAGVNEVAAGTRATVKQSKQGSDAPPLYAVDVARLGGMYANQIYLVGTEAGVGVHNAGAIGAAAGDLIVTASGRLENVGTLSASHTLQASAIDIGNQGSLHAGSALSLTAGNLVNAGQLTAGMEASIKIQGEVNNGGGRIEAARIDLASDKLRNAQGSIVQNGTQALVVAATDLSNVAGTLGMQSASASSGTDQTADGGAGSAASGAIPGSITTPDTIQGDTSADTTGLPSTATPVAVLADGRLAVRLLDNTSGAIKTNGETRLNTETLDNRGGQAFVNSLVVAGPTFDNTDGTVTALRGFDAQTERFINDRGRILVGATFNGALGAFSNRQGLLQATRLSVDVGGRLDNSGGTLRQLGKDAVALQVGGELALDRGTLDVATDLALRTGSISGRGSVLNVTGSLALDSNTTSSAQGHWTIGGGAALHTGALDNSGGTISVGQTLEFTASALNNSGGTIAAASDASIKTGDIDNIGGILQANHDLTLNASGQIQNRAGRIESLSSTSTLSLHAAGIDNGDGSITNAGTGGTAMMANTITNRGRIGANGELEITAQTLRNAVGGSITSQGGVQLTVDALLENAGRVGTAGRLQMSQETTQLSNSGVMAAQSDIEIAAASVENGAGTIATAAGSASAISLTAHRLENRAGTIQADGIARLTIQGDVGNEAGRIGAGAGLSLDADGRIENREGSIESATSFRIHGTDIGNDGGSMAAAGREASVIQADQTVDNNGMIGANGELTVMARQLSNNPGGIIAAGGDLKLAVSDALANNGGAISAVGKLHFDEVQATLANSGTITAAAGVHLNLDHIDNRRGTINTSPGASLDLAANVMDNREGRLMAGGDALFRARSDFDDRGGVLQAAGSLDVSVGGILRNQGGVIEADGAHGTLEVRAAAIDNTAGRIAGISDGRVSVSAVDHIVSSGVIAANGQLGISAVSLDNSGEIRSGQQIELSVSDRVDNAGLMSAVSGLYSVQGQADLRNSGAIVAGGPLQLAMKTVDNAGGRISTAANSNANVVLTAQAIGNHGGIIMADGDASVSSERGFDGRAGLLQAGNQLQLNARGLVDVSDGGIETLSSDSTLQVHAGALINETGRIVNVGDGDTRVQVDAALVNSGDIAGNGLLDVHAQSVVNKTGGSIVSGAALALQTYAGLDNAGTVSSGAELTMDEAGAVLRNHGTIVANADIRIRTGTIDNDGGTLATAGGSGASVSLQGASLSNRGGRIVAERDVTIGVDGGLDNSAGRIGAVNSVQVMSHATLTNDGGTIEASGSDATLALFANSVHNDGGRIVNIGQGNTTISVNERLDNDGLIAGNAQLDLRASTLVSGDAGTISAARAMKIAVESRIENTGMLSSGAALDIEARSADLRNSGVVVAGGELHLTSANFDNSGGQLATASGSGASLVVDATDISNRAGKILSDRDAQISSATGFDNVQGTLQAAGYLVVGTAGMTRNDGGVIEALNPAATLAIHAGGFDNGSGRVVNVGSGETHVVVDQKLINRGLIAGSGNLRLDLGALDNRTDGSVISGRSLRIDVADGIDNAGTINSQGGLMLHASLSSIKNEGSIVSGADIALHGGDVDNAGGTVSAAGTASIAASGNVDNRHGRVHANNGVAVDTTGALVNQGGLIEAVGTDATLDLSARSIDNGTGRVANIGTGVTRIVVTDDIINHGTLAANGSVDLSAASIRNEAGGLLATGAALDLHATQALDNAGKISAGVALNMDQAAARIANSGEIVAAGTLALHAASISNDGGQMRTLSGADLLLNAESTLSNRAGVIGAAGNALIDVRGGFDNTHGLVQTPGQMQVRIAGGLTNVDGTLESVGMASSLSVQAGGIDNTAGRIVNTGRDRTTVDSVAGIVNTGLIGGNGAVELSTRHLQNESNGVIASGNALELKVSEQLENRLGTINSGGSLHFDQAAAALTNTGRISAASTIDIGTATITNHGGQLYTANGSGAAMNLRTESLDNTDGTISSDGGLRANVTSGMDNNAGTLHGGMGTTLTIGSALANGSGIIEAAAGALEIHAQSIDSQGRILNAGVGATTITSVGTVYNRGVVGSNGALDLRASRLDNQASGQVQSGGAILLDVREEMANAGAINSGGTLTFDQAGVRFANSGQIGAGDTIAIAAATVDNRGGQIYTAKNSDAAIKLRADNLDNTGGTVSADGLARADIGGSISNDGGTVHGGRGVALTAGGALVNGSGTIEAATGTLEVQAQSIGTSGRVVNAGTGLTTIASDTAIANSGTIAANGVLVLSGQTLRNASGGAIGTASGLELDISKLLDNQGGVINSGGSLRFVETDASLLNSGRIGAGGAIELAAADIGNHGGQIYTSNSSGATISLHTDRLDNTAGVISADGLLQAEVDGNIDNGGGAVRGGTGTVLAVGGALINGTGTIEAAAGALDIRAHSVDSAGRISNAGTGLTSVTSTTGVTNSGTIAGNGVLNFHASTLENWAGGQIASGAALVLDVAQQLSNAGDISSAGTLSFDKEAASFTNSGQIAAAGNMRLNVASFDNRAGHISTVKGSGADIAVATSALDNRGGMILADGDATFSLTGALYNGHGTLQAGADLALSTTEVINNDSGVIEALGAGSSLTLEGQAIVNGGGRISNAGSGDMRLSSQTSIDNGGLIAGMGNVLLSGQTLSNQAGATLASGGDLTLAISGALGNQGKINSTGKLTFDQAGANFTNGGEIYAGGNATIHVDMVNNDGGHLGTGSGSGADLSLRSHQLSNQGGRIATDRDLVVETQTVRAFGELFGGRDLSLIMEGDYVQSGSTPQLHSNRNLALSVSGNITNNSTLEAAGTLTLSGQQITNEAGASIEGAQVILNTRGNLANAGEINGAETLAISAVNLSNSGGIVGGDVSMAVDSLDNAGSTALIGATDKLVLGIAGTLNNRGGATLYSSGDMTIHGRNGGSAGVVNNISSTIEATGNLALNAGSLSNVRENVQIVQVKTVDETVHMSMPSWFQYGDNHNSFETSAANYRPHEVYFVSPSDILEDQVYVTPDGFSIHRAVIRTHANDSAFYVAATGLYTAYGKQERLTLSEGTRVIYYTERAEVSNPDQGGPASNAIVHADSVTNWTSTVSFSNQYGNCSSNCIRLITQPGYDDPRTTRLLDTLRALAPVKEMLEVSSEAHHAAVEDQLAPGVGAVAQILSGGNMHLTVDGRFENRFGDIKAKGSLVLDGKASKENVGATLYRTHTFDGTWRTYGGQTISYQQQPISEVIGLVTGVIDGQQGVTISGRSFSNIDIAAGTVGNIRETVNVIGSGASGAGTAGLHIVSNSGTGGSVGGYAAAGSGTEGAAGLHIVASGAGSGNAEGQISGSGQVAYADLASAVEASNDGIGSTIGHTPVASGIGNVLHGAGTASGSGYVNGIVLRGAAAASGISNGSVANGAVEKNGATHGENLNRLVSVTVNQTHLGSVSVASGPSDAKQANSVRGTELGSVTKVAPSGLFIRNPDANGGYLFETRPQFANQQKWTSSDYLLDQLSFDAATTQKRLGDGFYEQRMVREQLSELTGHASYNGASDDRTYKQLLTNAVSFAQEFGLRPGVALSAEQVSHLTSDIAWLESQTVMLPDGRTETVLVPKVYLAHINEQTLTAGGALVTGNGVTIHTTENIANRGGVIDGGNGRTLLVAAQDIVNQGGSIKGNSVVLAAERDVRNESLTVTDKYEFGQNGGSYTSLSNQGSVMSTGALDIAAGRNLSDLAGKITAASANLTAGQDISFGTIKTGSTYQSKIGGYTENDVGSSHQVSQIVTAGDLRIAATGNLNLVGTQVDIGASGRGSGQLLAGEAINMSAVTNEVNTSVQNDPRSKQYDKQVHVNQTIVGTGVSAANGLTVSAGLVEKSSINVTGSSLTAGDALKLTATDSVNILSTQELHLSDTASTRTSSSLLKSKTTQQAGYVASSMAVGSALSGKTIEVSAGKDINVLGSAIAGDGDVSLAALGSVNVGAATSTLTEAHHTQIKESGLLSGGGFGISYGTRTTTIDQNRDAATQSGQSRSMVGSLNGDLNIVAGNAVKVSGSDLGAGVDMNLVGHSVTIAPGQDDSNGKFKQTMVQDGLTLAIGGSVVNAIQTSQGMGSAAAQTKDGRIKALAAATVAMTAKDAIADYNQNGPSAKISLTLGHSESESTQATASSMHSGSTLAAGNNIAVVATGAGKASNIDVVGSKVHALGNVSLTADNQVNLLAAEDTESQHSLSKSMSAAVGVAINLSLSEPRYGITASASASRGNVDGEGRTYVNSHVVAGNQLTVASGGDTSLKGAEASGKQVVMDVKGNLNIESLQDTATLDGKRESASISGTLGAGTGLSGSVSHSKVHNDYASVQEQSGIRTGDGGFQIQVSGNTDLKGGVISSTERAIKDGNNGLTTRSLSFSEIQNRDISDASGLSLGANLGKNQSGDPFSPSIAPGSGKVNSSQSSITRSGISGGALIVEDQLAGSAVASLNRDVITGKDTAQALAKGWTGAQALDEVGAQMQITSAALPRLAKEIGDFSEAKVAEMKSQGNVEEAEKWSEGGIYRIAAHAALSAMGGGLDGALGGAAVAGSAPLIDEIQHSIQENLTNVGLSSDLAEVTAKLIAGTTAGAIGATVGGQAGLITGLNADMNNRQLHESETNKLEVLKRGKSPIAQHRLDAAACALTRCADGVPTGDALYSKLRALQIEGQSYSAEQTALKGTGEFVYQQKMDMARDVLTSHAELVHRTGGLINLGAGAVGTVGGGITAVGGVASCAETLGLGCAVGVFGAGIATASTLQAQQGSQALFGTFQSSEGQRVLNSFKLATYPGEYDPLENASVEALKLGITVLAGKFIPKGLAATESLVVGKPSSVSVSVGAKNLETVDATSPIRINNNFYRDGVVSPQALSTSSNVIIRANPEKTTTVLGTFAGDTKDIIERQLEYPKSLNYLEPKKGGFNLLNTPDEIHNDLGPERFWKEINEPFLRAAMERGDDIYIATTPTALNTRNPTSFDGLSGFGREYKYLTDRGYVYDATSGKVCYMGCRK